MSGLPAEVTGLRSDYTDLDAIKWLMTLTRAQLTLPAVLEQTGLLLATEDMDHVARQMRLQVRWEAVYTNPTLGPRWCLFNALPLALGLTVEFRETPLEALAELLVPTMYLDPDLAADAFRRFATLDMTPGWPDAAAIWEGEVWSMLTSNVLAYLNVVWDRQHGPEVAVPLKGVNAATDQDLGLVNARRTWEALMDSAVLVPGLDSYEALKLLDSRWARRWPELSRVSVIRQADGHADEFARSWVESQCRSAGVTLTDIGPSLAWALTAVGREGTLAQVRDLIVDTHRQVRVAGSTSKARHAGPRTASRART